MATAKAAAAEATVPVATLNDLVAALSGVLTRSMTGDKGAAPDGLTKRVTDCAALVRGGTDVAEAMQRVGYGRGFIRGNAATFGAFLASEGLLSDREAARAFVGELPAAPPPPADDTTDEED